MEYFGLNPKKNFLPISNNFKMKENHDCLNQIRQQLKDGDETITHVVFDLSTIRSMSNENPVVYKTGQRIDITYKHKKRNGTEVSETRKSFVTHAYCPFCGEKYE